MSNWIFGVVMAVFSLLGLLIASRAHAPMLSAVGFLLTAFGLALIFWLIARNTGGHHGQLKH